MLTPCSQAGRNIHLIQKVIVVLDGDTIEVLKDIAPLRIRFYGIDWAEHDQNFGTRSKQCTSNQVFRKKSIPLDVQRRFVDTYGVSCLVEVVAVCGLYAIMGYMTTAFEIHIEEGLPMPPF